jgi:integrase
MTERRKRRAIVAQGTGASRVRVVEGVWSGGPVWRVEFRTVRGTRSSKVFPRTSEGRRDALAFAAGVGEQHQAVAAPARLSLEEVWRRYQAAEFPAFRPNTVRLYTEHMNAFGAVAGWHVPAEDIGRDTCALVRTELAAGRGKHGARTRVRTWGPGTLQRLFSTVRTVYRWAEDNELIARNRVERFRVKVAKDARPKARDEYTADEFLALLAALPLEDGRFWRAHVSLALCGWMGLRQHEALHLRWEDVDWAGGTIRLRSEWQKMGDEWPEEMMGPSLRAVLEAAHARQGGPSEGWVLPAQRSTRPYHIGALWRALKSAEGRAGVARKAGRGGHGLRRLMATDVAEITGNPMLALRSIRDRDPKQLKRYVKDRDEQMRTALAERETAYTERREDLARG